MICAQGIFKARLIDNPRMGHFTIGKVYDVLAIWDGTNLESKKALALTDFLVADDAGVYRWVSMGCFKAVEILNETRGFVKIPVKSKLLEDEKEEALRTVKEWKGDLVNDVKE